MSWIVVKRPKTSLQGTIRPLFASQQPFEHIDEGSARLEARRLARENPNFDFLVFGATSIQSANVTLEETVLR